MPERVDKSWKSKGLSAFSTDAIFGTLRHYGVAVDEASFREAAKDRYPLEVAGAWTKQWKGTGQFLQFPFAAADELLRRLFPERLTPLQLAQLLIELVALALRVLDGQADDLSAAFDAFDAKQAALPPPGARRDAFNGELVAYLEAIAAPFNELPRRLAEAGHQAAALRFAGVHEAVFPERVGCVTALVETVVGDRAAAVQRLAQQAGDPARSLAERHAALDALCQAQADDALKAPGLALFDAAAAEERWPLADAVAHLLANVVRRTKGADEAWAGEVVKRFSASHEHVAHEH